MPQVESRLNRINEIKHSKMLHFLPPKKILPYQMNDDPHAKKKKNQFRIYRRKLVKAPGQTTSTENNKGKQDSPCVTWCDLALLRNTENGKVICALACATQQILSVNDTDNITFTSLLSALLSAGLEVGGWASSKVKQGTEGISDWGKKSSGSTRKLR